jgi:hypothetical protein
MLGGNFINARNAEVDRNRRLRSENRQAFQAFVEMQKETGNRVDPEEFNRFARSLGTTPYLASGLPSEGTRANMATSINAEVAAREVARANQQRAAQLARAQSELAIVSDMAGRLAATNVDLGSEEGQAQLGQILTPLGITDISAYAPLLPVIQTETLDQRTFSVIQQLQSLGLNTPEAAAPFLANQPQAIRDRATTALQSAEGQRQLTAELQSVERLDLPAIFDAAGRNVADAIELAEGMLGRPLSERARSELDQAMRGLERGRVAGGVMNVMTNLAAIPPEQLAPLANNPAALEGLARQRLAAQGITNPTEAQMSQVMAALTPLAQSATFGVSTQIADNIRLALPRTANEELASIETALDAEAWIGQALQGTGVTIDQMPADVRQMLISDVMRMSRAARGVTERANEAQWNRILAGVVDGSPVGAGFLESMLNNIDAGDEARFEQMNVSRRALGLEPYESMSDPAFIEDYQTVEGLIRRQVRTRNEARTQVAQQHAASQVARFDQDYQDRAIKIAIETTLGTNFESPLGQVASRMSALFYFGSRDHFAVMGDLAGYLEDNPRIAQAIENGDAQAIDTAARLMGAAAGLVPNDPGAATTYEMNQYAAGARGQDWEYVTPGQRVPTFLNNQVEQVRGVIDSKIAAINALPVDADPAQIEAILEGVSDAAREVVSEMREAMSEGGLRYILDYSGTREAPLAIYLSAFEAQIADAIDRLEQAAPQGQRLGIVDNGDGTVTLEPDNAQGRPPGVYTAERSPTGRIQAGEPINVVPPPLTGQQSQFADPAASPFMQGIQGIRGDAQLTRSLNEARTRLATGGFGPAASPAAQALNFFRPTDPERNAQMAINGAAMEFLSTPAAREFLSANPETRQLLDQDPVSWVRLAQTGSAAPSRTQAIIAPNQ